jgi:hypothetical protein
MFIAPPSSSCKRRKVPGRFSGSLHHPGQTNAGDLHEMRDLVDFRNAHMSRLLAAPGSFFVAY